MPTVTYAGKWYSRAGRDPSIGEWIRGSRRTVSQSWLDDNRHWLLKDDYIIEGDEAPHSDAGNDGIPDSQWRKADIMAWLDNNGIPISGGYKTKSSLLSLVEEALSPAPVEEPVVEAAEVVESIAEEPVVEEAVVEPVVEEPVVEEAVAEDETEME